MEIEAISGKIGEIKADAILAGLFESTKQPEGEIALADQALGGAVLELLKQGEIKGKFREITLIHSLGKLASSRIAIVGLGKKEELTSDKLRQVTAEASRFLRQKGVACIATTVWGVGINDITLTDADQATVERALLGLYTFKRHLTTPAEYGEVKRLLVIGKDSELSKIEPDIRKARVLAEATNLARDMINEPANVMTPTHIAEEAASLAKRGRRDGRSVPAPEQPVGPGGGYQPPPPAYPGTASRG